MKHNEDVVVYLKVDQLNNTNVPPADKAAILSKTGDDKVAAYLDIKLMKKIGSQAPFAIHNTKGAVPIAMKLPDNLIPANASNVYITYCHDGVAKTLPASFSPSTKTLSFNAIEFSTYALVYTTNSNVQVYVPQTGDHSKPFAWMLMMLCSAAMMAGMVIFEKKRAK